MQRFVLVYNNFIYRMLMVKLAKINPEKISMAFNTIFLYSEIKFMCRRVILIDILQ